VRPIHVSLFTKAGIKPSPNTGVSIGLSGDEVFEVSIIEIPLNSLFTAARASGFVNK